MRIIRQWCEFCELQRDYDKSHFYTLFWEGVSEKKLKTIFQYFPNSDELFTVMSDYLFGSKDSSLDSPATLVDLARRDVTEKKCLIHDNIALIRVIDNAEIEFTSDSKIVELSKSQSPYVDFCDSVNDKILDNWIIEDKKAFALYEAFYGLTKYYELVWYLFQPLINTTTTFEYYYKLSKYRGIYSFVDNKLIVSKY